MTDAVPTMRRIDAHHHLWDLSARPQSWIVGREMDPLRRDFGVADLAAAVDGSDVGATIVVQAVPDIAETEELLDLAAREPLIGGVVGWVDIAAADVGDQLDRLQSRASGRCLVGVRSMVQYEPDPNWLSRPEVLHGLRAVADRGLVHDLLISSHQIDAAVAATRTVSDGTFVIDHLAKPNIAAAAWEPWATGLTALARCPNVAAKMSGLVTESDWAAWTIEQLRPYTDHAVDAFGPARLLFGSDWPVCTLAASYDRVVESIEVVTGALTPTEQAAVFGGNAARVYLLDGTPLGHTIGAP